jgi:sugar/nucleoside kinase (ribokinase family)
MKINELFEEEKVTDFLHANSTKGGVVAFDANIPKASIHLILDFFKEDTTSIVVFEPTSNVKSLALFNAATEHEGNDAIKLLRSVSIITPNTHELKVMANHAKSHLNLPDPIKFVGSVDSGLASSYHADAAVLLAMFPVVLLKLGREGVILYTRRKEGGAMFKHLRPTKIVENGNSSGAGDTLVGTLVSEMSRRDISIDDLDVGNHEFVKCVENGIVASVQSVESLGDTISRKLMPFE